MKHGMSKTKIYRVWSAMKRRCYNANSKDYHRYGERGIAVCDEWRDSFIEFYKWSESVGYKEGLSIDRIDNNLGYCPSNCRFTDNKTQSRNKRNNRNFVYNGKSITLVELSEAVGIKQKTLQARLSRKTSVDDVLKPTKSLYGKTKGTNVHNSRLNESSVLEIRRLYESGSAVKDIATKFKVSESCIHHVVKLRTWRHVA